MSLRGASSSRRFGRASHKPQRFLQCESLEARQLLAVVTSLDNAGPGTLRDALINSVVNEVITFDVSGTINTELQLFVSRTVVIDGTGQNVTVNNITPGQRVFNVGGQQTDAVIRNLTITGGELLPTSPNEIGGGIRVQGATLTIEDSVIDGNTAGQGGGIGLVGTATLNLVNSTVSNSVARDDGGGIQVPGGATLNMTNSTVEGNTAGTEANPAYLTLGGGINLFGTATLSGSTVSNNVASNSGYLGWGGGIAVYQTNASLTAENSVISGNFSDRGGGLNVRSAPVIIRESTISGNTSGENGGGIRVFRTAAGPADILIEDSTFSDNVSGGYYGSTAGGGAIGIQSYANSGPSSVSVTVRNSTFTGNTSPLDGGAIESAGGDISIENSTFYGNQAGLPLGGRRRSCLDHRRRNVHGIPRGAILHDFR